MWGSTPTNKARPLGQNKVSFTSTHGPLGRGQVQTGES